jgi:hypothetical protein
MGAAKLWAEEVSGDAVMTVGARVLHVGHMGEWGSGQFQTGAWPITVELG